MAISTYTPRLSVRLLKTIKRTDGVAQRYAGASRDIDLTPYLGDDGAVRTTKRLDSPAGGFSITFPDMPEPSTQDSLYALIEPMDVIEIRAAHDGLPDPSTGLLPLLMRGFVASVRRTEQMGDGGPQRVVAVQGQDAGKLWINNTIFWEVGATAEANLLSINRLRTAIGLDEPGSPLSPVSAYLTDIVLKAMNPRVAMLAALSGQVIQPFTMAATVKEGSLLAKVSGGMVEGPFWNILDTYCDRPWNELFIVDLEAGPQVVFRPAPYYDLAGALIMPDAADPGTVPITEADIVALDLGRSDARVANFFWCPPGGALLGSSQMASATAIIDGSNSFNAPHDNNAPALFGQRKMVSNSMLTSDDVTEAPDNLSGGAQSSADQAMVLWPRHRALQLQAMNWDNSVFEEGGATLKGSPDLQIGKYLQVIRGDLLWRAYITSVSHNLGAFLPWTSQVSLERGTGFVVRCQIKDSPFYAEGRRGPYSLEHS